MGDALGHEQLLFGKVFDFLLIGRDQNFAVGFGDTLQKLVDLLFNGGNFLAQRCALILR
ncbi:hypothetical protein [Shinella granuli]|uniref:Uncharacterized protein n=1 Tax=Shinella granuli TaxID=323621 RepID=A0A4R2CYI8_SHIGR|nr:hypothetical protein [Shinella granuli]TCN46351.1 hypothetical protein EV665_10422 [Shinella granuli]